MLVMVSGAAFAITVAGGQLLLFPFQLYSYFFSTSPKAFLLSERAALLLLLLVQNRRSEGWQNPYRDALVRMTDTEWFSQQDSQDGSSSVPTEASFEISYSRIYSALIE